MSDFLDEIEEKERLKGDVKIPFRVLLRRMLAYVRPEIGSFILAGFLILLNVGDLFHALAIITQIRRRLFLKGMLTLMEPITASLPIR